jgi:hypothetical protein
LGFHQNVRIGFADDTESVPAVESLRTFIPLQYLKSKRLVPRMRPADKILNDRIPNPLTTPSKSHLDLAKPKAVPSSFYSHQTDRFTVNDDHV